MREVNRQRDKYNILYTRRDMVRCGMVRNFNGVGEETQRFPHLQEIVGKFRVNFNGEFVSDNMHLDGDVTGPGDQS